MLGEVGKFGLQAGVAKKMEALKSEALGKEGLERQRVAQEFASFLFMEVLKAMRASIPRDGLFESDSLSRDIYTVLTDTEIARLMARRDVTGFTKVVEKSLEGLEQKNQAQGTTPDQAQSVAPIPIPGTITSVYGLRNDPFSGAKKFHNGVDVAAPAGSPISAVAPGKVIFSGWEKGYGNLVTLDHGNGVVTRYAHNAANLVAVGDEVDAGQPIALVGATGRATDSHLHFEVHKEGKAIDPKAILGEYSKGMNLKAKT